MTTKTNRQQSNHKYYLKVREQRLQWKKKKVRCICGKELTRGRYYNGHLTSKLHHKWLNKILISQ